MSITTNKSLLVRVPVLEKEERQQTHVSLCSKSEKFDSTYLVKHLTLSRVLFCSRI